MSLLTEFKEFAVKGNAIDMAVGIIIGAAFGKTINSLVTDIILPPIGMLLGGTQFSNLKIVLKAATAESAEVAVMYGKFVDTLLNFLIVAFSIFMVIKVLNKLKEKVIPVKKP